MTDKPILKALIKLLAMKPWTNAAEIAKYTGKHIATVHDVLFDNRHLVGRDAAGRITSCKALGYNIKEGWRDGKLYIIRRRKNSLSMCFQDGEITTILFEGMLWKQMAEEVPVIIPDASGINWGMSREDVYKCVLATDENIAKLESYGLRNMDTVAEDYSAWVER